MKVIQVIFCLNNFNVVENSKKIVLIKNIENQSISHYNPHCVDYKKNIEKVMGEIDKLLMMIIFIFLLSISEFKLRHHLKI